MRQFGGEWLVIGADGLIGRALVGHLEYAGKSLLETTRRHDTISEKRLILDLEEDILDWRPPSQVSVAYLCAAVSSLESCRKNPAQSERVNVHNTVTLANTLVASGTFVIFPSTNLVYDGSIPFRKAEDPVCPVTEYGRQKAEAERQLLALGDSISVVRFTKVLGPNIALFKGWIRALQNEQTIRPFSDMVMAPVSLPFAVHILHCIAEERLPGIVQVSGRKDVTYEQVARHIAQRIGVSPDLVQPMESRDAGLQLEAGPSYTTLDTTRLCMQFGIEPPDVWATIDSVFGL
jgi:dTDP-4-dehydrorhamnose reductase